MGGGVTLRGGRGQAGRPLLTARQGLPRRSPGKAAGCCGQEQPLESRAPLRPHPTIRAAVPGQEAPELPRCTPGVSLPPMGRAASAPGLGTLPGRPPRVAIRAAAWNPGASPPSGVSRSSACFPKIIVRGSATTTVAASREALRLIPGLRFSLPRVAACWVEQPARGRRAGASPKRG